MKKMIWILLFNMRSLVRGGVVSRSGNRKLIWIDNWCFIVDYMFLFLFVCCLVLFFFFGGILCGFSEKIFFWRYWEIFCIIGLIFLILGVVLLFVFIVLIIYCRKEVGWFIVLRKLLKIFFSCWSLFVFFLLLIGLFDKMCYFLEDLDMVCD